MIVFKGTKIYFCEDSLIVRKIESPKMSALPNGKLYFVGTDKVPAFYSVIARGPNGDLMNARFEEGLSISILNGNVDDFITSAKKYFKKEQKNEVENQENGYKCEYAIKGERIRRRH